MRTDSDMLTEVVKRGEGWTGKVRLLVYIENNEKHPIYFGTSNNFSFTVADLIADHEFMKAVWKGWTCLACNGKKTEKILGFDSSMKNIARVWCNDCNGYVDVINTNTYHALEALKLLHAGENAIKYLYDNLPSV